MLNATFCELVKVGAVTEMFPEPCRQMVKFIGVVGTVGFGFTTIVFVAVTAVHPPPVVVNVKVTVPDSLAPAV